MLGGPRRGPAPRALAGLAVALAVIAGGVTVAEPDTAPTATSFAEVLPAAASTAAIAGLHPDDIADAYGLTGGVDGLTVGVVVAYDTPTLESDLAVYRSAFGLPACTTANGCFTKVDQSGGTAYPAADVEWGLETSLDVQAVSAACPGCRILVVEAANDQLGSLGTAVNTAVRLGAAAVTNSWGGAEGSSAAAYSARYFTHPGVALVAASGDDGYGQVSMPATLPHVIAVGGTSLTRGAASAARIAREGTDGVVVRNGEATPSAAVDPHLAALAAATAALRSAQARVAALTAGLAAAKRTATTAAAALRRATTAAARAGKAVRTVRRSAPGTPRVAAAIRTRRTATAARTRARTASTRAAARVRALDAQLTAARRAVPPRTAAVAAARSVLEADRAAAAPPATPVVPSPAASSPAAVPPPARTPDPAPTSAPVPTTAPTTAPAPTPTASTPATGPQASRAWQERAWSGAGSGCSAAVAEPAWQTGTTCSTRAVADVAAVADPDTGFAVYDTAGTAQAGYTDDGWLVMGGTSLAAPLIAGMLVRSGHAADHDDAGFLYTGAAAFWDVTAGSNGSCAGSAVCTAGPGWDGPTGVGTPRSLASF